MNFIPRLQQNYIHFRNWSATPQGQQALQTTVTSFSEVAVSLAIQKIAISLFALEGGVVLLATITAIGLSVALLSALSPLARKTARFIAQLGVINLVHQLGLTVFIHEMGHAMAAAALCRSGLPKISLSFFGEGSTTYTLSKLSALGEYLGRDKVRIVIAAAGPLASVAFAMGMFAWSSYQTDGSSAQRLMIHGAVQLGSDLKYAWESIGIRNPTQLSNDFHALHKLGGIHPKTSFAIMALLPAIQLIWINRTRIKTWMSGLFQ